MQNRLEVLADQFRVQGHKLTQPRRIILEVMVAAHTPLLPADILAEGQRAYRDLGLVTVYRTLELMESMEMVRAVHIAEGCHGYVLSTPGHTHHLVCERCHMTVEIEGCEMGDFLNKVAERTGYSITGHWLELSGLCVACQKQ